MNSCMVHQNKAMTIREKKKDKMQRIFLVAINKLKVMKIREIKTYDDI